MTRYELLDRIGVGGMAEIFRGKAVAAGGFEKPVAIKRILPNLSQDPRFVELLIAEAKVLSLLKHRNIVQIFDVGLGDDGKYFLVMEFVDGKDLGAVQRAFESNHVRVAFDLALHIGAEICEALEHAHVSRGPDGKPMSLVHRDVSPSNVLLSRAGEVKLTDFGIAKRAEQEATQGGAVRGKFAYISPEQARNEHLDPRSDVFSVGILVWELLCNRRLWSGLDDMSALRAVREAKVIPPTEANPSLPGDVDAIVMQALSPDPARRYATAGAFGAKLRSLRYSLETTSGDPATELARIVELTEQSERHKNPPLRLSSRFDFDHQESTVIRIRTADAFSARDNDVSLNAAREVIDRFEEEETRLAQVSGDQLRILRQSARREESEPSDEEATRARAPLDPALAAPAAPSNRFLTPNEDTRILRRTPPPERVIPPTPNAATVLGPPPAPIPLSGFVPPPRQATPSSPFLPPQPPSAPAWSAPIGQPNPQPNSQHDQPDRGPFMLQPWVLIVIATFVAILAFVITRAFLR